MSRYLITPTTWRTDEYRDVIAEREIEDFDHVWGDVQIDDNRWRPRTLEEALELCDVIDGAESLADACRMAHRRLSSDFDPLYGTELSPEARTAYGTCDPLWP